MRAKLIEPHVLQEQPEYGEPICSNSNYRLLWEDENAVELAAEYEAEYKRQKEKCLTFPAPDFEGEVGKVYTEGIDYRKEKQVIAHSRDVPFLHWINCDDETYNLNPSNSKRIIAVPIASESQDDLWETVESLILNGKYDYVKQQFSIKRKKQ